MESLTSLHFHSSSSSSSPLLFRPSLLSSKRRRIKTTRTFAGSRKRRDEGDYRGGRLVDMNMIVLRKRIHEMKMVERNYQPPSHWTHWEKQCYANYDSLICELIGILQSELMKTRPSVALGIMAFFALSVPFSTAMVFSHFMDMANLLSN